MKQQLNRLYSKLDQLTSLKDVAADNGWTGYYNQEISIVHSKIEALQSVIKAAEAESFRKSLIKGVEDNMGYSINRIFI